MATRSYELTTQEHIQSLDMAMSMLERELPFFLFKLELALDTKCDEELADKVIRQALFREKEKFLCPKGVYGSKSTTFNFETDRMVLHFESIREDLVKQILAKKMSKKQLEKPTVAPEITRDDQLAKIRATGIKPGALNLLMKGWNSDSSKSNEPLSNEQMIQLLQYLQQNCNDKGIKSTRDKFEKGICALITDLTPQQPSSSNTDHTKQSTDASSSAPAAGST